MSSSDATLDVSTLRYANPRGGLAELTEHMMISSFVRQFESMNKNVTLTRAQLQECWFYALHREYAKILSNTTHITQEQLDKAAELLSRGIEQADTIHWLTQAERDAADLEEIREMNERFSQQGPEEQKASLPQQSRKYDSLALLSITNEVRMHAERLYEEGFEEASKMWPDKDRFRAIQNYKQGCAIRAQRYVIGQLKGYSSRGEEANQAAENEGMAVDPQSTVRRSKGPKGPWKAVWRRISAERNRIASELGRGSIIEQDIAMDIDTSNNQRNRYGVTPETEGHRSVLSGMTKSKRREFLRNWKNDERFLRMEELRANVTTDQGGVEPEKMHEVVMKQQQIRQVEHDTLVGIEVGVENLLKNRDTSNLQQQEHQSKTSMRETARSNIIQIKAQFEAELKEKMLNPRRQRKLKTRLGLDLGGDEVTAQDLYMSELALHQSAENSGPGISHHQRPEQVLSQSKIKRKNRAKLRSEKKRLRRLQREGEKDIEMTSTSRGSDPSRDEGQLTLSKYSVSVVKQQTMNMNVKAHTEHQSCEGTEMEIEISGRIAGLEI